jgi:hypothetical protein
MTRPNYAEVTAVKGGYIGQVEAFGQRDYAGIAGSKWKVCVLFDEFGSARIVGGQKLDRVEVAVCKRAEEHSLDLCAGLTSE